jgi:dipeptidyl-peptidase-4
MNHRILPIVAASMLTVFGFQSSASGGEIAKVPGYETREIRGWTVHFSDKLLAEQKPAVDAALPFLEKQLDEILRVVPAPAVAKLKEIPIWFSPEYPGVGGRAEYHPGAEWLKANGRNPAMVKGVEVTDTKDFEKEMNRMPNFMLHELAHGYHDRVLSFEEPDIIAAYKAAKEAKLYDKVERWLGNGRPNTFEKAYGISNHKEYFAEATEAYFSRNDFYPFNRAELEKHDPKMFGVLKRVWKVEP